MNPANTPSNPASVATATIANLPAATLVPSINEAALGAICTALSATWSPSEYGPQLTSLAGQELLSSWTNRFFAPITELGVLTVQGVDAQVFLQGQLTNDTATLAIGQTMLAGYCTAKGRLLATMRVLRDADQSFTLLVSRPLAAALRKRLAMYVMRAKCVVTDCSDQRLVLGFLSDSNDLKTACEAADAVIFSAAQMPVVDTITTSSKTRFYAIIPIEQFNPLTAALGEHCAVRSSALWRWIDCVAAQPHITALTSELFVPQMVNLELVDGVSFKKGCYPGQEVVARSHYLGKSKRRMFLGHSDQSPAPGSDVSAQGVNEAVGIVVMAAPHPTGGFDVLFESQIEAALNAQLLAGTTALKRIDLPYAL